MATTVEQIDIWRQIDSETQNLEFKEAKNQYDTTKLCKYCVAIANEGGGHIIFGVQDKLPRKVVGTNAFLDVIDITSKIFTWVGFRVDVEEISHPEGRILVFTIPARPRGTAYHYQGAYLMRSGEELVPMSEDQLRKIFAEGLPSWLEEIAKKDVIAQDVIQLLDTQTYFDLIEMVILPFLMDRISRIKCSSMAAYHRWLDEAFHDYRTTTNGWHNPEYHLSC